MGMRLDTKKAKAGFVKLKKEMRDVSGITAERCAKKLYKDSQDQVPEETGALKASARFVIHDASGPRQTWGVKYGYQVADSSDEEVLDYAAAVHEILKASHKPPTKAKYVEDPLIQGLAWYRRYGITECKRAVRRSFG